MEQKAVCISQNQLGKILIGRKIVYQIAIFDKAKDYIFLSPCH